MNKIDDGGPAFPVPNKSNMYGTGLSLRDYFAARCIDAVWCDIPEDANRQQALSHLGKCAYEMADAMIEARSK